MARTILIEATPWDNAGAAQNVYLAGGGSKAYTWRGRNTWKAGIATDPKFTVAIGFDESGWTGGSIPQTTKVQWFPADKATLSLIAAYQWINAPIVILAGDDAPAVPVWTAILTGTVASIKISGGAIEFTIADLGVKLADPFLTARFGGTGGVDGAAGSENRIKRRSFGKVFNVEGQILNVAANVYEFGDPAFPLNAFVAVRDKGRVANPAPTVLAWQGSIAATYAALAASAPASGSAVVAPSIACVKWWTQPAGPLTADIQGEVGAAYTNTVVGIAQRIASTIAGLAWTAPLAAVTAGIAGTDEAGIHVADENETTAGLLDRLLLGASLVWVLDPAGSVQVHEFTFTAPVEALSIVDGAERVEAYRPNISRRVAYQRSYRIHTDGEISAAVKTADIEGLGALGTQDVVAFSGPYIKTALGATATDAAYQTIQGTAAGITGQGTGATASTLTGMSPTEGAKLGGIAAGATTGVNLMPNADFRDGSSFYTLGTGTRTAGAAGDPAPFFIRYAAAGSLSGPTIPVPANAGTLFIGWSERHSGGGGFTTQTLNFYNAAAAFISGAIVPAANPSYSSGSVAWQQVAGAVTVPAGAAFMQLIITPQPTAGLNFDVTLPFVQVSANSADVTSVNIASGIAGQGAFATVSSAAYGSSFLTGFGAVAARNNVRIGTELVRADGVTATTDAGIVTSLGQAASIAGQGAFATVSSAAYGSSFLTGFGTVAARNNIRIGTELVRADGVTATSDAAIVTALGQAASIVGQGAGATANNLTGLNATEGTKLGGIADSAGVVVNLTTTSGTLTYGPGNRVTAPPTTNGDAASLQRYANNGVATFRMVSANPGAGPAGIAGIKVGADAFTFHQNGNQIYPLVSIGASNTLGANFAASTTDLLQVDWDGVNVTWRKNGTVVYGPYGYSTAGICYLYVSTSLAGFGATDITFAPYTDNAAGRILYSSGGSVAAKEPAEAGANVTSTHNAAGIAGQGALATKGSVDLETGDVTNKTRIGKLAASTGRATDATLMNTQLLLGPFSTTNLAPSYTVGGSNVTVSLPSHVRSYAGASGKVDLSYGAVSGTVAFSTYWTAYIDDPSLTGFASPTAVFTTNPDDLLGGVGRYQIASGITPASGGSGGSTTGGGGGGTLPRPGGGVYP